MGQRIYMIKVREQNTDTDDVAPSLDDDVSSENSSDSSLSIVDASTDQDSQVADVQSNHEEESEQDTETTDVAQRSAENGRTISLRNNMVNENSTESIVSVNEVPSRKDSRAADIDYFRVLGVNFTEKSSPLKLNVYHHFMSVCEHNNLGEDDSDSDYDPIELSEDMIDFQDFLRKTDDAEIIAHMESELAIPDDYPFTSVFGLNVLVAPQGKTPRCGNVAFKCAEENHEAGKCPCDHMWNKASEPDPRHSGGVG
ncbi:hypothetical protein DAPPUDRAFT_264620 [Daphnia pulex]|uniref:Uncharacterized protein n=1 Tax=Daphnia pulex TaxID=6669 RepID=E9HRZ1_DAPPU|nr:hypothetical protein DAPPUDRAFT_264620 [Daphnia pulex]|eukprot:EFX65464.1 hypothetical protein DAPPUDRAFT_264620 [Daphnia pulex]